MGADNGILLGYHKKANVVDGGAIELVDARTREWGRAQESDTYALDALDYVAASDSVRRYYLQILI